MKTSFAFVFAVALVTVACSGDDTADATTGSTGSGESQTSSGSITGASGGSTTASAGGGGASTGGGQGGSGPCSPPCEAGSMCCPGGAADTYYCFTCPQSGCVPADCPKVP